MWVKKPAAYKDSWDAILPILRNGLKTSKDALLYLKGRGVSARQVENYKIGYVPVDIELTDKVFREKPVRLTRDNLVFPLEDEYGEIRGVVLRKLTPDGSPNAYMKINWSDLKFFVYGLGNCLESVYEHRCLAAVEGILDCLAIEPYFKNVGALLTSRPYPQQEELLQRYIERFIFVPDSDKTGYKSEAIVKKYVSETLKVTSIRPAYKDPSKWREKDFDSFKAFYTQLSEDFLNF